MADPRVPDDTMRAMAKDLGGRANELAAAGRVAEVPALWEEAIAGLEDERARDRVGLAYAWYQEAHGEIEHGVRLAAGLRASAVAPVRQQVRVLVREGRRVAPAEAERTWRAAVGEELPHWAFLTEAQIEAVAKWITAESWDESETFYDSRIRPLPSRDVDAILTELAWGGDGALDVTIAVHRALLALGGEAGYRSVRSEQGMDQAARAVIAGRDWDALRACGTIEALVHGWRFLGAVHVVVAQTMTDGGAAVEPRFRMSALVERITASAPAAGSHQRERAVEDLAAIGGASLAGLLAALR